MKATVIGSGHVGLVSGACPSEMGDDVVCVDVNERKFRMLKDGRTLGRRPRVRNHARGVKTRDHLAVDSNI